MSEITIIPLCEQLRKRLKEYYVDDYILEKGVIIGGFPIFINGWTTYFGDIDVFTRHSKEIIEHLKKQGFKKKKYELDTGHIDLVKKDLVMQIVPAVYDNPEQIIDNTDLDYTQAFITSDGLVYTERCKIANSVCANEVKTVREYNANLCLRNGRLTKARLKKYVVPYVPAGRLTFNQLDQLDGDYGFSNDFTASKGKWINMLDTFRISKLFLATTSEEYTYQLHAIYKSNVDSKIYFVEHYFITGEGCGDHWSKLGIHVANDGILASRRILFKDEKFLLDKRVHIPHSRTYELTNIDPHLEIIPHESGYHELLSKPSPAKSARK